MKKLIIIICAAIFILCSTLCVMAENETFTVTLTYLDQDSNSLKDDDIYEYELGADVAIPLDSLSIEGYEITSVPETTIEDKNITINSIEKDEVITINYLKLNTYKVVYNFEDGQTKEEIKYGKVGESIPKESDHQEFFGNKFSTHDESFVLGNDSAIVNIYYICEEFITHFDLNGGTSGPNSLYQKYGTKIENIEDPYKEGYEFIGWFKEKECLNKVDVDNLYVTGEVTYYAGYLKSDEESLVTIVFYGENANDDRYSYLGKIEKNLVIGDTYTYDPENEEEHYYHSHDLSCYGVSEFEPVTVSDTEFKGFYLLNENLENGYVYCRHDNRLGKDNEYYYLRYNGNFYKTDKDHISYQIGETRRLKDYIVEDEFRLFKASTKCDGSYEFEKSDTIIIHKEDNLVYVYLKRNRYTLSFGDNSAYPNNKYGVIEAKWGQMIYDEFSEISKINNENYGWVDINDKDAGVIKFY